MKDLSIENLFSQANPEDLAKIGISCLKKAVVLALHEPKDRYEADIKKEDILIRIGVKVRGEKAPTGTDQIFGWILKILEDEDIVEPVDGKTGYYRLRET